MTHRWAASRFLVALFLAVALPFVACSPPRPPNLAMLAQTRECSGAVVLTGHGNILRDSTAVSNFNMLVQAPNKLRMDANSLFGAVTLSVTVDGDRVGVLDEMRAENRGDPMFWSNWTYIEDDLANCKLSTYVNSNLSVDFLVPILLGQVPPAIMNLPLAHMTNPYTIAMGSKENIQAEVHLEPSERSVGGYRMIVLHVAGWISADVTFQDFRPSPLGPRCGAGEMAFHVTLVEGAQTVVVNYSNAVLEPNLLPSAFQVETRGGQPPKKCNVP